jgi:hypothetical protein
VYNIHEIIVNGPRRSQARKCPVFLGDRLRKNLSQIVYVEPQHADALHAVSTRGVAEFAQLGMLVERKLKTD